MSSSLQQAVYSVPQPYLVARDMSPKMGYMLGNPGLVARQEDPNAEEDPATDEEETTTSRRRTTTSRAGATRTIDEDDEEPTTTRRTRPTSTPTDDDEDEPRETTTRPKRKVVNACAWNRMIKGTNTTPLWLVLCFFLF